MKTMEEYIRIRRQTIATYVATCPILAECRRGERRRGASPTFHDPKPFMLVGGESSPGGCYAKA
jgi:hypothetical protein